MTRSELIEYCLTLPGSVEDYPFEDKNSTVMRHTSNRKWFALIFERDNKLYINLKCDPFQSDILRQTAKAVVPGWHMNKTHWNTVMLDGDVSDDEVCRMIEHSFELTKPR